VAGAVTHQGHTLHNAITGAAAGAAVELLGH
jgi:hypothetical protein